ncbi:MAG TPA: hypothetical protein VF971_07890, partial [Candidatus Limnocylindrales bacterium]
AGLAEFFLICWDLMRFAKEQGIPAQGRGSATSSIVSYTLGISRVEPIQHNLLFERFINEGRTTYPDVDIDFSSERREEVIQYVYERYGPEHTGMVCNLVTYRARSAVREVGYALGFPRPLVDRVAKALETYDSVMVRRDLEADGGFAEFFRRPGEGDAAARAGDAVRGAAGEADAYGLVDGMGQLNKRVPLVGKVPPWRQPPKPADPAAPRPFAWLADATGDAGPGRAARPAAAAGPVPAAGPGGFRQISAPVMQGTAPPAPMAEFIPARAWDGMESARPGSDSAPSTTSTDIWQESAAGSPSAGSPPTGPSSLILATGALERESAALDASHRVTLPEFIPAQAWDGMNRTSDGRSRVAQCAESLDNAPQASIRDKPRGKTDETDPSDESGGEEVVSGRSEPGLGPSASGMWEEAPESPPSIRPGGTSDDEGGPGDTPASVAWLRAGRGTGYGVGHGGGSGAGRGSGPGAGSSAGSDSGRAIRNGLVGPAFAEGRAIDPESGAVEPPGRRTDRLGRPYPWDPPSPPHQPMGRGGRDAGRAAAHSSVARIEPEAPAQPRSGSTVGMSDWERWLELCARIDGFPRHLSIHSGGMLVTAAPLIDIAPLERATMKDRVVVQFDKRDVETLKLIKLDLLGLGMLAAIDETLQLIESDCATCIDLDAIPEEIPEVFEMLQAADTVGVFQVESRAQMQTLPKSKPSSLDDLVVEVAIIRPGPIQGNAVHPYLRRRQGFEPVTYLHPSLEPVLRDSKGVILYQEQVMRIAIEVAGFSPAESDGFRRAMGTWRSTREMEKLHLRFVEGCLRQPGMSDEMAEELFRQVAAFASFGFAKSHAAAFARTAYESSFLKLFYPAQFLV